MLRWFTISLLILTWHFSSAQNDVHFGHYMFNPSYLNPSWAGSQQEAFVALQHRSQWLGYSSSFDGRGGAPNSQMFTGVVPIRNFVLSSVGLNISNDNLGPLSNLQIQIPVAYTLDFNRGNFSLGMAPGILTQIQDFDQLRPNEPDPLISGGRQLQTKMNLSAGGFYQSDNRWYLGIGVNNLLRPGFDFGRVGLNNKQDISTALHGGFSFQLAEGITVSPNALVRTNLRSVTFDLGGILNLGDQLWTGLSYRKDESLILFLGYNMLEDQKLKAGYSFDYVLQNQQGKAATSHEIFLRYDLPDLVFGGRKSVKTPRFTY